MTVKFYLKTPDQSQSLILARVLWDSYQINLSTKQIVETKFWIQNNAKGERIQRVKQTNSYLIGSLINQSLDRLKVTIQQIFIQFENENDHEQPNPEELRNLIQIKLGRKEKAKKEKLPTFMEYFKRFIYRSENGIRRNRKTGEALSKDTVKTYNTLLGHLETFNKYLDWKDINLAFHADYTEFLMEEYELTSSSIGKDFQVLKLVCEEAYYDKANPYNDYKSPYFSVSREVGTSIHLNPDEIATLFNLELSQNKKLDETRDLFIIGCLTGLRHSDFSKIKRSDIHGNKLNVKTVKGGKQLEVNLRNPMIQLILEKYPKELPKGAVTQVFNQNLYEICKDIPQFQTKIETSITKAGKKIKESKLKCEMVKSHTGRRSFCTNEVEAGTPIAVIMASSGHTTEKSFWKYVKLNKSHYYQMYDQILSERFKLKAV